MLKIKKIIIVKNKKKGEASVILNAGDSELIINKIQVDLNDGADPIKIPIYDNTPVISGGLIDSLKNFILKMYNKVPNDSPGAYEITSSSIKKLGVI